MLRVPQEAQRQVRVPIARRTCHNAIKQLGMILRQSKSLSTASTAPIVITIPRTLSIVRLRQRPSRRRKQTNRIMNPSLDLILIVQIRQIDSRLATAFIVL